MTDNNTPDVRDDYPSSWVKLARNESIIYIIDALLDLPSNREFNKSELAEMAGVSRNSVGKHMAFLVSLNIVELVEGTTRTRYRFNAESEVSRAIVQLEAEINRAAAGSMNEQPA